MNRFTKIGLFFVYWITLIAGLFSVLYVVRFFVLNFDIEAAIGAPSGQLAEFAVYISFVSLIAAWLCTRKHK